MFYQKTCKLVIVVLIVGCLLSACNAGASPGPLVDEPFVEQRQGFTIRYPEDWTYQWEDHGDGVQFLAPGMADQESFLPGPSVSIAVAPIEALGTAARTSDAKTMLDAFLEGLMYNVGSGEEGWVEETESITVDGNDAAVVTIGGVEDGTDFTGRLVFVHTGDRGAIVLGLAESKTWKAFDPTFEEMLASMTFIEPVDE
jgi:hypothetical protein